MTAKGEKKSTFTPEEKLMVLRVLKGLKKICHRMEKDNILVENAYTFANKKHDGVRRKDGSPYIIHCLEVAYILAELDRSNEEIAAGILHDTVEDTDTTKDDIAKLFGDKVAEIVEAVTNIEKYLPDDCELQKEEIDELSDVKLIDQILHICPEALYVKVADRLHNLSTMETIDNKRRIDKVNNTRAILIPLVKELTHASSLVSKLEDACLLAEQPEEYKKISVKYKKFLKDYNRHIERVGSYLVRMLSGDKDGKEHIVDCNMRRRSISSIHEDLIALTDNKNKLIENFTLRNIPLMDVFFVVRDGCPKAPEQVLYSLYDDLRLGLYIPEDKNDNKEELFDFTIVGFGKSPRSNLRYFVAVDCYEVRYRIFCEREEEYKVFLHGYGIQQIRDRGRYIRVITAEPSNLSQSTITVYTRKQDKLELEQGATVLDFAFNVHPKLALGAKYGYVNDQPDKVPLYTKLNHGDTVEIVSSTAHDRPEGEPYEEHAILRWEEWVFTKKARKALTRYLEEKKGYNTPLIMVLDAETGVYFDLVYNAVPLDLAFAIDPARALCFKEAFINKSRIPCALNRRLEFGDKVRIKYSDEPSPAFEWLRFVKSDAAREALYDYYMDKIQE